MTDSPPGRTGALLQSQFLRDSVDSGDLDTILRAARAACVDISTETWSEHCILAPLTEGIPALKGAPAALIFTSATSVSRYGWLEYGMFLQSLKLAAQPIGLTVVPLNDIDASEASLRELMHIPRSLMLLGAVAVGYLDHNTPVDAVSDRKIPVTIRYLS